MNSSLASAFQVNWTWDILTSPKRGWGGGALWGTLGSAASSADSIHITGTSVKTQLTRGRHRKGSRGTWMQNNKLLTNRVSCQSLLTAHELFHHCPRAVSRKQTCQPLQSLPVWHTSKHCPLSGLGSTALLPCWTRSHWRELVKAAARPAQQLTPDCSSPGDCPKRLGGKH